MAVDDGSDGKWAVRRIQSKMGWFFAPQPADVLGDLNVHCGLLAVELGVFYHQEGLFAVIYRYYLLGRGTKPNLLAGVRGQDLAILSEQK